MAITPPLGSSFQILKASPPPRRLIIAADALERHGKTHFSMTAPGPVAYMEMDPGGYVVLPKFQPGGAFYNPKHPKQIWASKYKALIPKGMTDPKDIAIKVARPLMNKTITDFDLALQHARTTVVDTATEWYSLCKLSWFGKLTQVMPEDYNYPNTEYKRLIRNAYEHNSNLILIHKLKDEYEQQKSTEGQRKAGKKTGRLVRDGFKGTGYEVDMNIRLFKNEDNEFNLEIIDCRANPQLDGEVLPQSMCNFTDLAMLVYPDSKEVDWR